MSSLREPTVWMEGAKNRPEKHDIKSFAKRLCSKDAMKGFSHCCKMAENKYIYNNFLLYRGISVLQNLVFSRFFQPCNFRNYFWEIKVGTKMQFQCVFTNFWSIFFFNFEHCEYVLRLLIKYMSKIRTEN